MKKQVSGVSKKNLFTLDDLSADEIHRLCDLAERCGPYARTGTIPEFAPVRRLPKGLPKGTRRTPYEMVIDMQEPSTRTVGSQAAAARHLGCSVREISGTEATSLVKGEGEAHNTMMLAPIQGADVYALRTKAEGTARYAAETIDGFSAIVGGVSPWPCGVVGLGDGCHGHVTQGLLDLNFLRGCFGRLDNFALGIVGGLLLSRTAAELLRGARICGYRVKLFCRPEHLPVATLLEGVNYSHHPDGWDGIGECDAINFVRPQNERATDAMTFMRLMAHHRFTPDVRRLCKDDVVLMHAQPIKERDDLLPVFPRMYDRPEFRNIQQQAAGGVAMRMAVYIMCLENLGLPTEIPEPTKVILKPAQEMSVQAKHDELREKSSGREFFKPIWQGTVIDRLTCEQAMILHRWLLRAGKFNLRTEGVKTPVLPLKKKNGEFKGVVVLENVVLDHQTMSTLMQVFPEATFNVCDKDRFTKYQHQYPVDANAKLLTPDGVLPCPNPACVTNQCAQARTGMYFNASGRAVCRFCERPTTGAEVQAKIGEMCGPVRYPGQGFLD